MALFFTYPDSESIPGGLSLALGPDRAQRFTLECALLVMAKALRLRNTEVFVFFAPPDRRSDVEAKILSRFGKFDGRFIPQAGRDPGERMHNALAAIKDLGFPRQMVLETSSPTTPPEFLQRAVDALSNHECVIGPTWGGGYYLIAVRDPDERTFRNIAWGSGLEFGQTYDNLATMGRKCLQLPRWQGTDSPDDLPFLKGQVRAADCARIRSILEET